MRASVQRPLKGIRPRISPRPGQWELLWEDGLCAGLVKRGGWWRVGNVGYRRPIGRHADGTYVYAWSAYQAELPSRESRARTRRELVEILLQWRSERLGELRAPQSGISSEPRLRRWGFSDRGAGSAWAGLWELEWEDQLILTIYKTAEGWVCNRRATFLGETKPRYYEPSAPIPEAVSPTRRELVQILWEWRARDLQAAGTAGAPDQ